MSADKWVALSLACAGLTFVMQSDTTMRVVGLTLFTAALALALT
jgi:hypothetical protein